MGGRAPDAEPGAGDEPLPLPGAVDLGSEGETAAKASSVAELAPLPVADIRAELDLVLASGLGGSELRRAELAPVTRLDLVLASELRRAELAPLLDLAPGGLSELRRAELAPLLDLVLASELRRAELAPLLDLVLASGLGGPELAPLLDLVLASELRRAELAPLPLPVASGTSGLGGSESEDLFSGLTAPAGSATGTAVLSSGFSSRLAFTF
jgi:hypothetical protein